MTDATQRAGAGSRGVDTPRRRWSEAQKRRIVAESYRSGDSVSVVAQRHGVNASVLFTWRRRYRKPADTGAGFIPVVVEAPEEASTAATGQLELELDELTASATEDDLVAETAPGRTTQVKGFERRQPSRKPFPEHLARERVNNAAWFPPRARLAEVPEQTWEKCLAVNVTGPFLMSRFAIPVMARGGGGSIIHIASQMARVANYGQTPYCTAKGALLMLAKGIALDHAADNIRCNTLSPGGIATPSMGEVHGSLENAERVWGAPMHPLGRLGRVEEIAAGAVFLASDESSFMTGADLLIDGGYTAR